MRAIAARPTTYRRVSMIIARPPRVRTLAPRLIDRGRRSPVDEFRRRRLRCRTICRRRQSQPLKVCLRQTQTATVIAPMTAVEMGARYARNADFPSGAYESLSA